MERIKMIVNRLKGIKRYKHFCILPLFLILMDIYLGILPNTVLIDDNAENQDKNAERKILKIYFVHGYESNNSEFSGMIEYLNKSKIFAYYENNSPYYFDYYRKYLDLGMTSLEINNLPNAITAFATNFYEELISNSLFPVGIDIVAHSLGGLIVREMLRLYKTQLKAVNITINRIITLGTPHHGSKLSTHPLRDPVTVFIGNNWNTKIIDSIAPQSSFIQTLNFDPGSYMNETDWYYIAGVSSDPICYLSKRLVFDGVPCDGLVDWQSALAMGIDVIHSTRVIVDSDHTSLLTDKHERVNDFIHSWLITGFRRNMNIKCQ